MVIGGVVVAVAFLAAGIAGALAVGAVFVIIGAVIGLLAPANAPATKKMVDAPGCGCGAALWAVAGAVLICVVAFVLAVGGGLALLEGGL
jgi:galactitol-specific phosphotransferase system IIC component